jgi:DNA repair ATPase RecN
MPIEGEDAIKLNRLVQTVYNLETALQQAKDESSKTINSILEANITLRKETHELRDLCAGFRNSIVELKHANTLLRLTLDHYEIRSDRLDPDLIASAVDEANIEVVVTRGVRNEGRTVYTLKKRRMQY